MDFKMSKIEFLQVTPDFLQITTDFCANYNTQLPHPVKFEAHRYCCGEDVFCLSCDLARALHPRMGAPQDKARFQVSKFGNHWH